jgi:hypothetical protein
MNGFIVISFPWMGKAKHDSQSGALKAHQFSLR